VRQPLPMVKALAAILPLVDTELWQFPNWCDASMGRFQGQAAIIDYWLEANDEDPRCFA
jgi:hypothetical protein